MPKLSLLTPRSQTLDSTKLPSFPKKRPHRSYYFRNLITQRFNINRESSIHLQWVRYISNGHGSGHTPAPYQAICLVDKSPPQMEDYCKAGERSRRHVTWKWTNEFALFAIVSAHQWSGIWNGTKEILVFTVVLYVYRCCSARTFVKCLWKCDWIYIRFIYALVRTKT